MFLENYEECYISTQDFLQMAGDNILNETRKSAHAEAMKRHRRKWTEEQKERNRMQSKIRVKEYRERLKEKRNKSEWAAIEK